MKRFILTAVAICIASLACIFLAVAQKGQDATATQFISDYTHWKKANNQPVLMEAGIALLCSIPAGYIKVHGTNNPHDKKWMTVFVNKIGEEEFFTRKEPHFPEGSVIVKQKLSAQTNGVSELLTVMLKHKSGFDPANGDWEYLAFDGKGTKKLSAANVRACQDCHEEERTQDYVFRGYASYDYRKLK